MFQCCERQHMLAFSAKAKPPECQEFTIVLGVKHIISMTFNDIQ